MRQCPPRRWGTPGLTPQGQWTGRSRKGWVSVDSRMRGAEGASPWRYQGRYQGQDTRAVVLASV